MSPDQGPGSEAWTHHSVIDDHDPPPQRPTRRWHPLLRAAGVEPAEAIRWGEASRYGIFGALVLFTTAMSTAVVLWAITIATDAPLPVAITVAAIWGYGIFHIDRWLVSTHVDRDGFAHRLWLLVPRLAIAVPMGLLVSWFAMLGVADKEIRQQLDRERVGATATLSRQIAGNSDLARQRELAVQRKLELQRRYLDASRAITPTQAAYDAECAGTSGTRVRGCGPVARQKLRELETAKRIRDDAKAALDTGLPTVERTIIELDARIAAAVADASVSTQHNDGVFARRAALGRVLEENPTARRLYRMLEVVIVLIDVVPAVAKVLTPATMVDMARSTRRRRLREELDAAAAAERGSDDMADAFRYAAAQRANTLRLEADARRLHDLDRLTRRPHARPVGHRAIGHRASGNRAIGARPEPHE